MTKKDEVLLVLEDSTVFKGYKAGYFPEDAVVAGEVVFNTALAGYQEVITDPSYKGQIICFTYPHIGNYGINEQYSERDKPFCEAVIVRNLAKYPSFRDTTMSLEEFLYSHRIPAITSVDTRALTRHLRNYGSLRAAAGSLDKDTLLQVALNSPGTLQQDLVRLVTKSKTNYFKSKVKSDLNIVVFDFGVKNSTIGYLTQFANVTVVPANTKAEDIIKNNILSGKKVDGVLLSNGPGDPAALGYIVKEIKVLIGKIPIFGICLGHQLLAQALNLKTYKLRFGHHGANHPVKRLKDGRVEITSQNHNYAVDPDGLNGDIEITHINLNDNVLEGLRCASYGCFSVQYHPEAAPGPYDSIYLFEEFRDLINQWRSHA